MLPISHATQEQQHTAHMGEPGVHEPQPSDSDQHPVITLFQERPLQTQDLP